MSGSAAALANVIQNVPIGLRAPGAVVGRGPEAVVQSYAAAVLTLRPVAYWRLGQGSGDAIDLTGNGNTAVTHGAVTYGIPGALAGDPSTGCKFDGSTAYFGAAAASSLSIGDVVSVAAWVSVSGVGTYAVLSKGANAYYLRVNAHAIEFLKSQVSVLVTSTSNVPATGWHFVVATKNGATVKLYLDAADVTGVVTNAALADNAVELDIGSENNHATNFLQGSIQEPAIFNYALNAAQVAQLWHLGSGQ